MPRSAAERAFADGMRPLWAQQIHGIEVPQYSSIENWLITGAFAWSTAAAGKVELSSALSNSGLTEALASEIARFSCASYESLLDGKSTSPSAKALGWQLVRHYYSAFFSAHAILRIAGIALNYLSPETVVKLNRIGGHYLGASPQLTKGLYSIRRDPGTPTKIVMERISTGGGSHEDLWEFLLKFLPDVESSIIRELGASQDALAAVNVSERLRQMLCLGGRPNGAWPSTMRNAINYRQEFGVWYPYSARRTSSYDEVSNCLKRWEPIDSLGFDFSHTKDELISFAEICSVLSHMLTATLSDISARAPRARKSFVDRGPFKLLRERQISL